MSAKSGKISETPNVEYERRFLVGILPSEILDNLENFDHIQIEQGYNRDGIRFRKSTFEDGKVVYERVEKKVISNDGRERSEKEKKISRKKFDEEWVGTINARIYKTRYVIPYGSLQFELDIFLGRDIDGQIISDGLKDRKLLEIEFPNKLSADRYQPEDWFGRDVTKEITNKKLAHGASIPEE